MGRFLFALNMLVDELNMSGLDSNQLMESQWPVTDFAMVVAGDGRSVEPRFMTEFLKSDEGMDSTALMGNFCFVGSEESACTQLANICAYFTRRWLQNPSSPQTYFEALRDGKVIQVIYNVQVKPIITLPNHPYRIANHVGAGLKPAPTHVDGRTYIATCPGNEPNSSPASRHYPPEPRAQQINGDNQNQVPHNQQGQVGVVKEA